VTKFKKVLSTWLLIGWSIILVFTLSFGTSIASNIYQKTFPYIKSLFTRANITDVTVEGLPEILVKEKTYYPTYTTVTDSNKKVTLQFENLTPDTLVLNNTGGFRSKPFDGEHAVGKILITSENDIDFEKVITLDFYTVYPNQFSVTATGPTLTKKGVAFVNLPIYLTTSFTSATNSYSETEVEYLFDEEYFKTVGEGKLLPLKETENATITARLKNGDESYYSVEILPEREEVTQIDEVKLSTSKQIAEGRSVFRYNETAVVYLYNGGKRVYTDFEIKLKDESFGSVTKLNYIKFKKAGRVEFTVTLPNGFTFDSFATVENVVKAPTVFEDQFNQDGQIEVIVNSAKLVNFLFPEECTYKIMKFEYSSEELYVYNTGKNAWSVKALKPGVFDLRVVIDDGVQSVSVDLVINAEQQGLSYKDWAQYAGKIFGHMGMFLIEGLLIIFFLKHHEIKSKLLSAFICASVGISLGAITEIIQQFIPGRSSVTLDILIDLTGYVTGIIIAIFMQFNIVLKKRAKTKERLKKQEQKKKQLEKREEKARKKREAKVLEEARLLEEAKQLYEAEELEKQRALEEARQLEESKRLEEEKILQAERAAREEERAKSEQKLKKIRRIKGIKIKKSQADQTDDE